MGFWQTSSPPPALRRHLLKFAFFNLHGHLRFFFFFSPSSSQQPSQHKQPEISISRGSQQPKLLDGGPLSLPSLLQSPPHHPLLRPLLKAPPILPFPLSNPPFSQPQLLALNLRTYSSPSCPNSTHKSPQISRVSTDPSIVNADGEIETVCKCLDQLSASGGDVVDSGLDRCGVRLRHDLVFGVLKRFSSEWKPALHFFNWTLRKCCPNYTHGSVVYNKMMRILGEKKQYETMVIFLEEMGGKGLLTMETFTVSFKAFASAKQRKKAVGCFDVMERHGFSAGVDTMNCLLQCLVADKLVKEAQILFEILKGRISPNQRTYSLLLGGWCRAKNLEELVKNWNEISSGGFDLDIALHNTMLEGLVRCHRRSDAMKLLFVMKAKGPNPDTRSYTVLIKYLCKHRGMEEAVELVHEMVNFGCYPDAEAYTCLINGYAKVKKMNLVCKLLKEMMGEVDCLEAKPYNSLMVVMVSLEMWDDALKVYGRMVENGVRPTTGTYNRLMRLHFQRRDCGRGLLVWEELKRSGCEVDKSCYAAFIGGLIRNGKAVEACGCLEEMLGKGMEPPHLDYYGFSADLSKAGRSNILDELAQKMLLSSKYAAYNFFARWAAMAAKRAGRSGHRNPEVRDVN